MNGMNGIISEVESPRILYKAYPGLFSVSAKAAVTFSLFAGFFAGYTIDFSNAEFLAFVRPEPVQVAVLEEAPGSGVQERAPEQNPGHATPDDSLLKLSHSKGPDELADSLSLRDAAPESIALSPGLTSSERADLMALLLDEQVTTVQGKADALVANQVQAKSHHGPTPPKPMTLAQNEKRRQASQNALVFNPDEDSGKTAETPGKCGLGIHHEFERPANHPSPETDTHLCPSRLTWISKTWDGQGWIKVEGSGHLPTLARHPSATEVPTLLLNEEHLGLLALRSGIQIAKGMGMIAGRVPEGYKLDFAGRSEETEYFESSDRKYFAILNAEPGAGVLELVSETRQDLGTTLFVPVLEDVVTYLDLTPPEPIDITVKVNKNGNPDDPEVVGLTVGLSTQTGIQAITRSDGVAILSQVRRVKGYPLFLDVGSRTGTEAGPVYRYEIPDPQEGALFMANQISDQSLGRWLGQIKQGLSDQGAMVVGSYPRNRIDGFKRDYFAKVQPLTAKFGLEPINFTVLWNGEISQEDPLEGDLPRFLSVQVAEGLSQIQLLGPEGEPVKSDLFPISPRVIHVVSH